MVLGPAPRCPDLPLIVSVRSVCAGVQSAPAFEHHQPCPNRSLHLAWLPCRFCHPTEDVEPNHLRFDGLNRAVAPCEIAASISSRDTRRRARTIPFKLETGTFGNITTLPSGCTKNLIWSPEPTCRWSRM